MEKYTQIKKENGSIISKSQMKRNIFISFTLVILLLAIFPILQTISRQGTYSFNAALQSVGSLFAIATGIALIILHVRTDYNWLLLMGFAYLSVGIIELVHGIFLFATLITELKMPETFIIKIIHATEISGELFFIILALSALLYKKMHLENKYPKFEILLFLSLIIITVKLGLASFYIDYQQSINYQHFISHPINLYFALFLLLILISLLFIAVKESKVLDWWIFLSVSIMMVSQLYISVSKFKLDALFEFGLFLKLLAYLAVLIGVFIYTIARIKQLKKAENILINQKENLEEIVSEQTNELKVKNEILTKEIQRKDRLNQSLIKNKEALKKSETHYKELFDNAIIGMYQTNIHGEILTANKALCKLLGFESFSELIKFSPTIVNSFIKSEEHELFKKTIDKEGFVSGFESRWLTKEQKVIYVRESARKKELKNQIIYEGTVEDITQQKIIEEQKKQKTKELKNIIETVNVPIFGINKNKEINVWNRTAEEITGYNKVDVLKKSIYQPFIKGIFTDQFTILCEKALKAEQNSDSIINIQSKEGKVLKFLLNTSTQYNTEEDITGALFIARDITQLDKYKDELEKKVEERTRELEKALNKEKELSELKSRFVSMASHEFRTPLAAISFAAGFVLKYWNRLEQNVIEKKLLKIEDQVKNMIFLLDGVLTLGKGAAGKTKLNKKFYKCKDFFDMLIDEVNSVTSGSHEIICKNVQEDCLIFIDENIGRKIFINLLTNAIKFSPDNDIVVLQYYCENNFTVVEIIDFGIGISKDEMEQVFIPFHRAENVASIRGTGLGLAIVKESVELLNGSIEVSSEEGKGSHFKIQLPLPDKDSV